MKSANDNNAVLVERVQTGVRIEKKILKVLKGLAEYHDLSLGDLLEGIVLHAFEGKAPFGEESMKVIQNLKALYKMDYSATNSHHFMEKTAGQEQMPGLLSQ